MDSNIQDTLEKIKGLPPEEAILRLDEFLALYPDCDEAFTIRGLKNWSINKRREAINDYLTALKINPESRARTALDYANSILDFYSKDLLNP